MAKARVLPNAAGGSDGVSAEGSEIVDFLRARLAKITEASSNGFSRCYFNNLGSGLID